MSNLRRSAYVPLRNVISLLVPTVIAAWYFIDKVGDNTPLRIAIVGVAIGIQAVMVVVSTRTRRTRRSFFWGVYDFLTGKGRLPLRLLTNAIVLIALIALAFEVSGLKSANGVPSEFIVRYVEVNLYLSILSFLGASDNAIDPVGFSKALTI